MTSTVSSTNYTYLQTANGRYSGLASGIDTESIVEKLMKAESAQKEKLQQQYQTFQWKRDAYRDFHSKLSDLREELFNNYSLTSSWSLKKATSSNSNIATVTATSSANGNLNISSITSLATSSSNQGTNTLKSGNNTLGDLGVVAGNGYFTLSVLQSDGKMTDKTISYKSTDTIDSFVKNLNGSGAGISAIFSNGILSLSTNATGATPDGTAAVKVIATPADKKPADVSYMENQNIFSKFNFTDPLNLVDSGTPAELMVNGLTMKPQSNTFSLNGYTVTLNTTLNSGNGTDIGSAITISSSADIDAVVDKIKSFVKSYNDIISSLHTATSEKKNSAYPPLTDAQKAEMSETEINAWNEKAKAGILRNDTYLDDVFNKLRSTMYSKVGDSNTTFNYLFQIGVTTTKTWTDGGQLKIDEKKLSDAISKDPNSVVNLFTNTDTGIVTKTRDILKKAGMDTIETVAGTKDSVEGTYSLGTQMISLKSKIDDWTNRLKDIENRYWNQFTAMETAISKANSVTSIFA